MTRRPNMIYKRSCTVIPKQQDTILGSVLNWLVATDREFRRTQTLLHPPGDWD